MKFQLPDLETVKKLDFKNPATWLATWFGCGLMRPAPGTWGSIGGLPLGLLLYVAGGKLSLIVGIVLIFALGLRVSRKFEEMTQTHDNSMVVIDEVAGIMIALLGSTFSPVSIVLAFLLFRFFDILKPWPIRALDRNVKGPLGVMIDDVAAGVAAAVCLQGIHHYALIG